MASLYSDVQRKIKFNDEFLRPHPETNDDMLLSKLKNLTLGDLVPPIIGRVKPYEDEPIDPSKIIGDLVPNLLADRIKNFGEFHVPAHKLLLPSELEELSLPDKYKGLMSLKRIDETTLRPKEEIWALLCSTPSEIEEIIEKQILLVCLNIVQSHILESIPMFEGSLLSYISTKSNKSLISTKSNSLIMRVTEVHKELLNLRIDIRCKSSDFQNDKSYLAVQGLLNRTTPVVAAFITQPDFIPQAMFRSIKRIRSGGLNHVIKPPGSPRISEEDFNSSMVRLLPTIRAKIELNEVQSRALYSICTTSHGNSPYILHGPPGTGKTLLISKTVCCLLQMDPNVRVLLTASSNMAADMIAEKIMDEFDGNSVIHRGNVLRLKSSGNDFRGRNKKLDPIMYYDSESEKFEIPTKFDQYRVVICTLGCSAHIINQGVPPGFFTHVFLDEAAQAAESEIWIPLGGLADKDTSVIFCGDPKQLGPVYTFNLPDYITKNFDSALVRYMKMEAYKIDPRLFCQLEGSYRCHKHILDIASRLFYESKLLSAVVCRQEPFLNWSALPNKTFPVLFVDVKGRECCEPKRRSYANPEEVKAVLEYIDRIHNDFPSFEPSEIGIISPYRHQTRLIKQSIFNRHHQGPNVGRRGFNVGIPHFGPSFVVRTPESSRPTWEMKKITVDSVERFQGSERKVIFLTATRTDGLGFIGCDLRLNTSITRAMHLLIVVGHGENLARHGSWKAFIDYCSENNSLIKWNGGVQTF